MKEKKDETNTAFETIKAIYLIIVAEQETLNILCQF